MMKLVTYLKKFTIARPSSFFLPPLSSVHSASSSFSLPHVIFYLHQRRQSFHFVCNKHHFLAVKHKTHRAIYSNVHCACVCASLYEWVSEYVLQSPWKRDAAPFPRAHIVYARWKWWWWRKRTSKDESIFFQSFANICTIFAPSPL